MTKISEKSTATELSAVEVLVAEKYGDLTEMSVYKFCKYVWCVREQMGYNYRKNGSLRTNEYGAVTRDEAVRFLTKWNARREERAAKVQSELNAD